MNLHSLHNIHFTHSFQAVDERFQKNYGCFCPIRTNFPGENDCEMEKFSSEEKKNVWSKMAKNRMFFSS